MTTNPSRLADLASLFLRLGATAFGGPAAHVAMMRDEVVARRRWLTDGEFLDLLAATHLIPGPNSTEMAIHLGYRRAGVAGLLVAGACFILPASLIVGLIAWSYTTYGDTPQAAWLMYGIGPIVIAIVLQAIWTLGRTAVTGWPHALLAATVAGLSLSGVHELVLLAGGAVSWFLGRAVLPGPRAAAALLLTSAMTTGTAAAAAVATAGPPVTLTRLTLFFLKIGSVLFGSGYVLLAFLRADLTERWGWLTEQQLIDAVTVGQVTPGPVFTTATFIGYLLGGWVGATLATVAIFAPGFVFVALTQPIIPRLRASRAAGSLLDGTVLASLGLMAAVTWQLGRAAVVDLPSAVIFTGAAVALAVWRPNTTYLIVAGGILGWLLRSG